MKSWSLKSDAHLYVKKTFKPEDDHFAALYNQAKEKISFILNFDGIFVTVETILISRRFSIKQHVAKL